MNNKKSVYRKIIKNTKISIKTERSKNEKENYIRNNNLYNIVI